MKKLGKSSVNPKLRQGNVYWIDNVPPLDGGKPKGRWVIVVDSSKVLEAAADLVVVVCCSSSVTDRETDRVPLSNQADTPSCRTGLPRACWAVPRWHVPVPREKLIDYRGVVSGRAFRELIEAYAKRVSPPES